MKNACLIFIMLASLATVSGTAGADAGRILIVHSYHESFDWVREINSSLRSVLSASGVEQRFFYMDTKRQASPVQIKASAGKAKQLLAKYRPDVVIAVDDNAQEYFAKDYVNQDGVQIVFCGVNADPRKYGYPAANVTGILERSYPLQTLHMLKILLPAVKKVIVVSDISPTSDQVLARIQALAPNLDPGISIVGYRKPGTFEQWRQVIDELDREGQTDALMIPLYHTVRQDGAQNSVPSAEILKWTLDHTQLPVVGLWPQDVIIGALLAVVVNPREHGRVAAKMALEILSGKRAGDIPVMINKEGYVMVNLHNKEHLAFDAHIDIDQIADQVIR